MFADGKVLVHDSLVIWATFSINLQRNIVALEVENVVARITTHLKRNTLHVLPPTHATNLLLQVENIC